MTLAGDESRGMICGERTRRRPRLLVDYFLIKGSLECLSFRPELQDLQWFPIVATTCGPPVTSKVVFFFFILLDAGTFLWCHYDEREAGASSLDS
jgi:hypothetical protein